MLKENYYLYCHTNKINGKKYIGISLQKPSHRWQNGKGYKGCPKFEKAIKKYGWNNFTHEILLDNLTQEEASKLEQEYISKYNTINNGYNILQGGLDNSVNGGILFNKRPVNQYSLNKKLIKTWNSAMEIERELGFCHSAITACCRRKHQTSCNYIWRYSDDCNDINDIILKKTNCYHGKYNSQQRKVNQYDLQGNFIKTWDCILDISKSFNKPTVLFINCCNRKPTHNNSECYFKTAYGYQWRYIDDCDDISQVKYKQIEIDEIDNNGNILHHFNSVKEAHNFYNDDKLRIYDTCYGKQKTTHGHIFRFSKEKYKENLK
jgi:hypothetical protein